MLEAASDADADAVTTAAATLEREYGASVVEDYRYDVDPDHVADIDAGASLDDVVERVNAPAVWGRGYTGKGVAIAVVDTGVDDTQLQIASKGVGKWAPPGEDPWTDWQGHGSMCACIATGTKEHGGAFDGIAPGASIIPCRTRFYDSELTVIYDYLRDLRNDIDLPIVASNSFGCGSSSSTAQGASAGGRAEVT